MRRRIPALATAPIVVPEHGRFTGLVTFLGDARIDGQLDGRVVANGTLLVAPSARVRAEIQVDELVVAGDVEGDVRARRVELLPEARVRGTLDAGVLALADGSSFEGRCRAGVTGERGQDASDAPGTEADEPESRAVAGAVSS